MSVREAMNQTSGSGRVERFFERLADITIIFLIFGAVFLFIYLAARYALIKPASRVLLFCLPLMSAGLVALLRFPRLKVPAALTAISLLFPLYLFETIQWAWVDRTASPHEVVSGDARSKMQVVHDLREQGKDVSMFINLVLLQAKTFDHVFPMNINGQNIIPLSGASFKTTVLCRESKAWAVYESDEHGFNNPAGLYKPGEVDIAILGDSFMHGDCVSSENTVGALLRKSYPRTISLGIGGAGPLTRFAVFREYVEVLKPKIVLYVYTQNTLDRIGNEALLRTYLNASFRQGLYSLQPQLDEGYEHIFRTAEDAWEESKREDRPSDWLWIKMLLLKRTQAEIENFWNRRKEHRTREDGHAGNLEILWTTLSEIKSLTLSWGGRLIFVYLATPSHGGSPDREEILSVVRPLSVDIIDLSQAFERVGDPSTIYSHKGGHFNEYGYSIVAETIANVIRGADAE